MVPVYNRVGKIYLLTANVTIMIAGLETNSKEAN